MPVLEWSAALELGQPAMDAMLADFMQNAGFDPGAGT